MFVTKCGLEKKLREKGFEKRSGGRHDIWVKEGFPPIPVPRHKGDISKGTLKNILKAADLENRQ
jgi:predicted RNA binding protein YcfA (HicA-like mRNA interferase family)